MKKSKQKTGPKPGTPKKVRHKGELRMKALEKMVNSGSNSVAMSNQFELKSDKRGGLITFGIDHQRATEVTLGKSVAVCFVVDLKEWDKVADSITPWSDRPIKDPDMINEFAEQFKPKWISVDDAPLIEEESSGRVYTTEAGGGRFMAAVPYTDVNKPGEELWWIHDCVFDYGCLCVVGEEDNYPAGWNIEDVTHYYPILSPPHLQTKMH